MKIENRLVKIIAESNNLESSLKEISSNEPENLLAELLLARVQYEKAVLIKASGPQWFKFLGWWFGKLLIWGTFLTAVILGSVFGTKIVNSLTFAFFGAAGYYALLQIFTPIRVSKEALKEEEKIQELENKIKELASKIGEKEP